MAPGLISTTADMWSADTMKAAFLGVTVHWIDMKGREGGETWEMRSEVISFWSVSGDHSGKNLGQYFIGVCDQIGIMSTKRSKVQSGLSIGVMISDIWFINSSTLLPSTSPQATPWNAKILKWPTNDDIFPHGLQRRINFCEFHLSFVNCSLRHII